MKIVVLKILKYRGYPIYIRRLDKAFEFLILFKNKIYTENIRVIPHWTRMFSDEPYSIQELIDTTNVMIARACKSIDALLNKKHGKNA